MTLNIFVFGNARTDTEVTNGTANERHKAEMGDSAGECATNGSRDKKAREPLCRRVRNQKTYKTSQHGSCDDCNCEMGAQ